VIKVFVWPALSWILFSNSADERRKTLDPPLQGALWLAGQSRFAGMQHAACNPRYTFRRDDDFWADGAKFRRPSITWGSWSSTASQKKASCRIQAAVVAVMNLRADDNRRTVVPKSVIPAKAGIQCLWLKKSACADSRVSTPTPEFSSVEPTFQLRRLTND
jgi:hypothetical protein